MWILLKEEILLFFLKGEKKIFLIFVRIKLNVKYRSCYLSARNALTTECHTFKRMKWKHFLVWRWGKKEIKSHFFSSSSDDVHNEKFQWCSWIEWQKKSLFFLPFVSLSFFFFLFDFQWWKKLINDLFRNNTKSYLSLAFHLISIKQIERKQNQKKKNLHLLFFWFFNQLNQKLTKRNAFQLPQGGDEKFNQRHGNFLDIKAQGCDERYETFSFIFFSFLFCFLPKDVYRAPREK